MLPEDCSYTYRPPSIPKVQMREFLYAGLAYCFLAGLALFQIFLGQVYYPQQYFNNFYPWRFDSMGLQPGWVDLGNRWLVDAMTFVGPQEAYISQQLKAGEFPLWCPRIFCGHPLAANAQSEMFYPVKLLLTGLFDWEMGHNLYLWFHMACAGLAFYLFMRLRVHRVPAFIGGVLWMLHGFMAVYLETKMGIVGVLIPLTLLAVDQLLKTPDRRHALFLGVVGAVLLVTSHKQFTAYAYLLAGLAFLVGCYDLRKDGLTKERWKAVGWAFLVAFLLSAPLVIPYLELASFSRRTVSPLADIFATNRMYPETFLTLFFPEFLGPPATFYLTRYVTTVQTPMELTHHLGMVGMLAAILGAGWRTHFTRFYTVVAAYLLAACAVPLVYAPIYYLLPGFAYFTPTRILMLASFSLCVLATLGLERWRRNELPKIRLNLTLFVYTALIGVVAWVLWQVHTFSPAFQAVLTYCFENGIMAEAVPNYTPSEGLQTHLISLVTNFYSVANPALWLPALAGLFFVVCLFSSKGAWRWKAGLTGVFLFLELTLFLNHWNPTTPLGTTFPQYPSFRLMSGVERSCGVVRTPPSNMMMPHLNSPLGYDSLLQGSYSELFINWVQRPVSAYQSLVAVPNGDFFWGWCSLMGVKWVYTSPTYQLDIPEDWKLIYEQEMKVYENPEPALRSWLVSDWQRVDTKGEALSIMVSPNWDYRNSAVVEAAELPPPPGLAGGGTATIIDYRPNTVTLDVKAETQSLLVLNDSFYPGWTAWIDGVEAPVLRTNRVFRGVLVEAGEHQVVFRFRPRSLYLGMVLCALGLGLCWFLARRPKDETA